MRWLKRGLIAFPRGSLSWAAHSLLQPTPFLLDDNTLRIYAGFRDEQGVSRVGYVDVDVADPSSLLRVSESPALDCGADGMFDDHGVVPTAIVAHEGRLRLYYAGFQQGKKIRFCAFTGVAESIDGGRSFQRIQRVPVTDRTDREPLFRVIHSIRYENGRWRAWYGGGDKFVQGKKKTLPVYNIRYMESPDGLRFDQEDLPILNITGAEYRIGRPYVVKNGEGYLMFFGAGSEEIPYWLAFARSNDGVSWVRDDSELSFEPQNMPHDKQMAAYPAYIDTKSGTYLFYNGNDYGHDGICWAVLSKP